MSINASELGIQFLRDATEQDNFESEVRPDSEHDGAAAADEILSDATLESAQQDDFAAPVSAALRDDAAPALDEPAEHEIDMRSDAIVAGSLFDEPIPAPSDADGDEGYDPDAEEADLATLAAPLREPRVVSDDPSEVDPDRQREIQRMFDERVKKRLRVDTLPGRRGVPSAGAGPEHGGTRAGSGRRNRGR